VFQTLHLIPALTVRQNIALAASLTGLKPDRSRINDLLEKLNLADKANRKPAALSQGEQQRAAIARAVLNRPALLLADEPTSALDDSNAQSVMEILESCALESNAALLIATHDTRLQGRFQNSVILTSPQRIAA
jgi:putative ABC transport system ATP-binding protein